MYYNGDLLDISPSHALSLGFIDDITYEMRGLMDEDSNAEKIQAILEEVEEWRCKHGAQFEQSKYLLIYFTRNNRRKSDASIEIMDIKIKSSKEIR